MSDNKEELYYVAKESTWDGTLTLERDHTFTSIKDARAWADETYWPSDELVILQIVDRRDAP